LKNFSKYQIATAIAILFHVIGITGILFFDTDWFVKSTFFNLLLMCSLLFYTQSKINVPFLVFFLACFVVGIAVEIIGTSTGWLFGNYNYGTVLGPSVKNVPVLIGINWFIIIYCCGSSVHMLLTRLSRRLSEEMGRPVKTIQRISIVVDGATLAVLFDYLMEPVAIKLGYWQWLDNGEIPLYNYICWFVISMILLYIFHRLPFGKQNKFAVNLLLIQAMFFLLLRTFL